MNEYPDMPWHARVRIAVYRWTRFRVSSHARWPEWDGPHWFNLGIGCALLFYLPPAFGSRGWTVWPWNAFRKYYADGSAQWGFGLLQIGGRHVLYQGWTRGEDGRESWCTNVLFLKLVEHELWAQ